MKKSTRKVLNYSIAIILSVSCICVVGVLGVASSGSIPSTPTSFQVLDIQLPIPTLIALTYSAARTQTAIFNPAPLSTEILAPSLEIIPTLIGTSTFTPTVTMLPTSTFSVSKLQTLNAIATFYANPTSTITPFIFPTSDGELYILPSSSGDCEPAYPDVCVNGNPRLNCVELRAKGIFHFRVFPPDPLGYDRDNDGIGCE